MTTMDNRRLKIAEQVKIDILSDDPEATNAVQRSVVSRCFICKLSPDRYPNFR
jgi:hypothetical protein